MRLGYKMLNAATTMPTNQYRCIACVCVCVCHTALMRNVNAELQRAHTSKSLTKKTGLAACPRVGDYPFAVSLESKYISAKWTFDICAKSPS